MLNMKAEHFFQNSQGSPDFALGGYYIDQLEKVKNFVEIGRKSNARLVVGGNQPVGLDGWFFEPTVFADVTNDMEIAQEEIFGPVLSVIRVKSYDEALKLVNSHQYGNGTAIFTRDGDAAREFASNVNVGMVGVNVPIPVPVPLFSFSGSRGSKLGDLGPYGKQVIMF